MMKESFSSIADTRQQSQVRHDLYEIIAMTIAAVIGNCDGCVEKSSSGGFRRGAVPA